MNVQPWAMYTPQAYQPYSLAGFPGGIGPGTGGGPLASQSLVGNLLSGLAGLPGPGIGGLFGYPPIGQLGYPPVSHAFGGLGGLLPLHAVPGMIPGVWGGPLAGQFALQGLLSSLFGQGAGLLGPGIGGLFGQPQLGPFGYSPVSLFGQPQLGPFGYPQVGQGLGSLGSLAGYPQVGQGLGSLGGLLPFYAAQTMIPPGIWSGQQPYLGGQWAPHGLMGNLLNGLAGHTGQPIGALPPFQVAPGLAAVA